MNPLVELHAQGQSFWYDNMRRQFLFDGTIYTLIANDGLRGMTSNPAIFEKAIGQSDDYDGQIAQMVRAGANVEVTYEALAIRDIQIACDLFTNLYEESDGGDGYVSLEVAPDLANDTQGTIEAARRFFVAVNRPNVMIKIPATQAGIPAIEQMISEGVNVNITLMFNLSHYNDVATAYINGLQKLVANGGNPSRVASVASFFISRVDARIDAKLNAIGSEAAKSLRGKVAIANAKLAYKRFQQFFGGKEFAALQAKGAMVQRPLWASTGTKDPNYPATLYVDTLIGPDTVNTMPPKTIAAFRDSGTAARTIDAEFEQAKDVLAALEALGIDLLAETEALQVEGVEKFKQPFDKLMVTIEGEMARYRE